MTTLAQPPMICGACATPLIGQFCGRCGLPAAQPATVEARTDERPSHHANNLARGWWVGVAIVAVVLAIVLPLSLTAGSGAFSATGTYTVYSYYPCNAAYPDISEGTEVTVTDETGAVLAFGQLVSTGTGCDYTFTVDDIPGGNEIYGIRISDYGTVHFTREAMENGPSLTLGG